MFLLLARMRRMSRHGRGWKRSGRGGDGEASELANARGPAPLRGPAVPRMQLVACHAIAGEYANGRTRRYSTTASAPTNTPSSPTWARPKTLAVPAVTATIA